MSVYLDVTSAAQGPLRIEVASVWGATFSLATGTLAVDVLRQNPPTTAQQVINLVGTGPPTQRLTFTGPEASQLFVALLAIAQAGVAGRITYG